MSSQEVRAPPSILNLSLELQQHILSFLVVSSFETIHSVLRTCRQLYEAALPLSVHTYHNVSPNNIGWGRSRSPNLQFLRYVAITKPHLAQFVRCITHRSFTVLPEPGLPVGFPYREVGLRSDERQIYHAYINQCIPEEDIAPESVWKWRWVRQHWIDELETGIEDAEISLLLLVCKRVTTFNFGDSLRLSNLTQFFDMTAEYRASSRDHGGKPTAEAPLSLLSDIYHESGPDLRSSTMFDTSVASILQLPRLRYYECLNATNDGGVPPNLEQVPLRSSTVEHLILREARLDADTFRALIRACKLLSSVEYTSYVESPVYEGTYTEVMPDVFMDSLLPHASSLTSLHVDFVEEQPKKNWCNHPHRLCMGAGLRQFEKLRKLVIGSLALTGLLDNPQSHPYDNARMPDKIEGAPRIVESVPESIQHLEIHQCGTRILEQVQEFLDVLDDDGRFPHLHTVRLQVKADTVRREDVKFTCNRHSINLEIIFETKEHRRFDLVHLFPHESIGHVCTRIHHPTLRELWLKYRGLGQGRARDGTGVLLFMPEMNAGSV